MNKIILVVSAVLNVVLLLALMLSVSFINTVTYVQRMPNNAWKIDNDSISSIDRELSSMEDAYTVFHRIPDGYEILIVYPWYKKWIPEKIIKRMDQLLLSNS